MGQNLPRTPKGSTKLKIHTIVSFGNKKALEQANQWSVFLKDLREEVRAFASSLLLGSEADTGSKC